MLRRAAGGINQLLILPLRRRLSGLPGPSEKARNLIRYGSQYAVHTLVETGTYYGDTVAACLSRFKRIYTIELDPVLYEAARRRFEDQSNVMVLQGDSCTRLGELVSEIREPALFWLDAHYSAGETAKGPHDPPLPWELRSILARGKSDILLIDDARLMGVAPGYPSVDEIRELVGERAASFEVRRDVIRITLSSA